MKKILNLWPILILLLVTLFFFHQVLFSDKIFVTPAAALGDTTLSNLPYRQLYKEAYASYQFPLWTDAIFTGYPIIGDPSHHMFFPLTILAISFFSPAFSYSLTIAVYFFLMSCFMYLYGRTIGLSRPGALLGSIAFSYTGFLTAKIMHAHFIATVMWFPLVLFAIEKLIETKKLRYSALLAISFSLQILAGHTQMTIYCILVSCVYFLLRWLQKQMSIRQKIALFLLFSLAILWSIGISSIQLLPNVEFLKYSERAKGISPQDADQFPFRPKELINFFLPQHYGNPASATYAPPSQERSLFWENATYIGILPIVLALLALPRLRARWELRFFLVLGIIALLLSFGKYTPVSFLLEIPPFSFFRVPSRFLFFLIFSLSLFAAVGFDYVLTKYQKYRSILIPSIIVLTIIDLYVFCFSFNVLDSAQKWLKTPETALFLQKYKSSRLYSVDIDDFKKNPFNQAFAQANGWKENLVPHRHLFNYLPPNSHMLYGLSSAGGYVALTMQRSVDVELAIDSGITLKDTTVEISKSSLKLLRLLGVTYLVSPFHIKTASLKPSQTWLTLQMQTQTGRFPEFRVYSLANPLPRAFLATESLLQTDPRAALEILRSDVFDPQTQVILEKSVIAAKNMPKSLDRKENTVSSLKVTGHGSRVAIKTTTKYPTFLVLTDTYYPGWKAEIDGKQVPIFQADYLFRAVSLPSGKHTVTFTFDPLSVKVGGFISLGTLVVSGIFLILLVRSRKQSDN